MTVAVRRGSSLFRRVGKYSPSMALDPRENRLTESFAAVLERVDGLASNLVAAWLDIEPPSETPTIRTQRSTVSGKFVDLEIRFDGDEQLLVWVEIKHGADLHENQLEDYVEQIRAEASRHRRVVLLAPRQSMPVAPSTVASVEWQHVARSLALFARAPHVDPIQRWLVKELCDFLKEEALADEDALSAATVFALAAWPGAERTAARVTEIVDGVVRSKRGEPTNFLKKSGSQQPNYGNGYWATFALAPTEAEPSTWGDAWLEWGFRSDRAREDSRDALAFFAGVTFAKKANPTFSPANQAWLAGLGASGFERVEEWYWRLWRFQYPEQLLVKPTLESQARTLADWVLETFQLADQSPPPTP